MLQYNIMDINKKISKLSRLGCHLTFVNCASLYLCFKEVFSDKQFYDEIEFDSWSPGKKGDHAHDAIKLLYYIFKKIVTVYESNNIKTKIIYLKIIKNFITIIEIVNDNNICRGNKNKMKAISDLKVILYDIWSLFDSQKYKKSKSKDTQYLMDKLSSLMSQVSISDQDLNIDKINYDKKIVNTEQINNEQELDKILDQVYIKNVEQSKNKLHSKHIKSKNPKPIQEKHITNDKLKKYSTEQLLKIREKLNQRKARILQNRLKIREALDKVRKERDKNNKSDTIEKVENTETCGKCENCADCTKSVEDPIKNDIEKSKHSDNESEKKNSDNESEQSDKEINIKTDIDIYRKLLDYSYQIISIIFSQIKINKISETTYNKLMYQLYDSLRSVIVKINTIYPNLSDDDKNKYPLIKLEKKESSIIFELILSDKTLFKEELSFIDNHIEEELLKTLINKFTLILYNFIDILKKNIYEKSNTI